MYSHGVGCDDARAKGALIRPLDGVWLTVVVGSRRRFPSYLRTVVVVAGDFVQFGCGLSCPSGWKNYDSSPRLRLQKLPLVGPLVPAGPFGRFPGGVLYGDIVRGLPLPRCSAALLYSSHVLEHLALDELRAALRNCRRVLAGGGTFRIVLPDLEAMINAYNASSARDRAVTFIRSTLMGYESRARTLRQRLQQAFGSSHHLWLWDYPSLADELATAGFTGIRRASFGDSGIAAFAAVEDEARWADGFGIQCEG